MKVVKILDHHKEAQQVLISTKHRYDVYLY